MCCCLDIYKISSSVAMPMVLVDYIKYSFLYQVVVTEMHSNKQIIGQTIFATINLLLYLKFFNKY